MRTLLHLCAIVLALPQVLLCALFLILGHMTGGGTLGSLVDRVLDTINILFTWGALLAIVAFVTLIVAGCFARSRRIAAGLVALIVIASTAILGYEGGIDPLLFLPGLIALGVSGWLTFERNAGVALSADARVP
jgi:hypothetical protein